MSQQFAVPLYQPRRPPRDRWARLGIDRAHPSIGCRFESSSYAMQVMQEKPEEVAGLTEREFFIDNLMVRIHLIIEIILEDRPCAMGV